MEDNNIKFSTVAINHTWDKEIFNQGNAIARKKGINFQSLARLALAEYLERNKI